MILEHFRIHNLFSYYGPCEFDLTPNGGDGRNVVLIWGRNGYGKTSFLNSLKLLLSGVSDDLRAGIHVGRTLKREAYLLGIGEEWMGVFNCNARRDDEKEFGVSLTWREEAGRVTVERSWRLEKNEVHEVLRVDPDFGKSFEDHDGDLEGEARAFLQTRLPDNIIPFYIYDAEMVQQIAEATQEKLLRHIEQLLDIADINVLKQYLGKNLTKWRRTSNDVSQLTINALDFEIQSLEAKDAQFDLEIQSLEEAVGDTTYAIRQADIALESRRQFALQAEEGKLAVNREKIATQLEEKSIAYFETFTREAPLVLHPLLMQAAVQELEKIISHPNRRLKNEVERIFTTLPERLLGDPPLPMPPLTENQEDFLRRKLSRIIESYRPDDADLSVGLFSSLSPTRAEALLRVVDDYAHNNRQRANWAQELTQIGKLKAELIDVDQKRNDLSNLAPQEQEAFQQRLAERDDLTNNLGELQLKIGEKNAEKGHQVKALGVKQSELRQEKKKLAGARAAHDKLGLGQKLQNALEVYCELLKMRRREDVEDAINLRFQELMTSHGLIHHIRVADDFSLHYLDAQDETVGMGNISAGMKQLVAQALLWGLKDVAGKEAPVVIDTPLARIDRKHQENLICRYYPNAGPQVIVLPTDSEMDEKNYALIKPYVYREYRLDNPEGDHTRIEVGGYY